jgi:23S rRNA pseudouridine1911/1915/1917 synthase
MRTKVIFEDKSLLVLDKPAGIVVNRAETTKNETIQDWLEGYLKLKNRGIGDRAGIVHRLDKETSGVLLVAKTKEVFENLQAQFKARKVKKEYTALVHGKVEIKTGTIEVPVGRLPWNRERFGVLPGGRAAETKYEVKEYYKKERENFSLLILKPKTGRTHQIRIHLKYLGYPIVSDTFYTGRKRARADRQWCPRLFLHAAKIVFKHPVSKKRVEYISELSKELSACLRKLSPLNLT